MLIKGLQNRITQCWITLNWVNKMAQLKPRENGGTLTK